MATALRPARAADVPFLAEVLCMAGRGHLPRGPWDLAVPDDAERTRLLVALAGGPNRSWCHQSVFHVADVDGVAGSALVAFEPSALDDAALARPLGAALESIGWSPERIGTLAPIFGAYLTCFPEMPGGTWIVENVGTRPELRRRGLLARLLDDALARGRACGLATAQIACLIGNEAAQRAYEKAGFRVVEERKDPAFEALLGVPGFSCMRAAL
jgi:ribosomal protein S18 acetylase RimI-like enzyme